MSDAANDLAFRDHRIDDAPRVMNEHDALYHYRSRGDIDLDLRDGGTIGISHLINDYVLGRFQTRWQITRQYEARGTGHDLGNLTQRDLPLFGAFDDDLVAFDIQIPDGRCQQVARDKQCFLANFHGGEMRR